MPDDLNFLMIPKFAFFMIWHSRAWDWNKSHRIMILEQLYSLAKQICRPGKHKTVLGAGKEMMFYNVLCVFFSISAHAEMGCFIEICLEGVKSVRVRGNFF